MKEKCKVEGCDRLVHYKSIGLCQMHYFRQWRTGSVVLKVRTRKEKVVMPGKGYIRVYDPTHPLADKQGTVSEHRKAVYARYGEVLPPCELCGKSLDWKTCHIDHIDNNVSNNHVDNLRPLCRPCNTFRDYPAQHTISGHSAITYQGETKTANEWSRDPRVSVSNTCIQHRLKRGMSVEEALFAPKKTHNGNPYVDRRPRKAPDKRGRKNAICIDINGDVRTLADWSRHPECEITEGGIKYRLKRGWAAKDAVFAKAKP